MTASIDTRKRSRDEDGCDAMPLSKRINNLHINHSHSSSSSSESSSDVPMFMAQDQKMHQQQFLNQQQQHAVDQHQYQMQQQHLQQHDSHSLVHQRTASLQQYQEQLQQATSSTMQPNQQVQGPPSNMDAYAPELNSDENPFYYNKNRVLYDLHVARMQRNLQ